jgi:hypothetical protein
VGPRLVRWDRDQPEHPPTRCRKPSSFCPSGGRGCPIRRPVDRVLSPDLFDIADQVDPLLGRAFLVDAHKLLVSRQACWLPSAGLQLKRDELGLVLVLCRKDLRKQMQNRLEQRGLELPAMAQNCRSFCWESHLVAIGLDLDFLSVHRKEKWLIIHRSNKC